MSAWGTPYKVLLSVLTALTDNTSTAASLDRYARMRTANRDAMDQYQKYVTIRGSINTPAGAQNVDTLITNITAPGSANYIVNTIDYIVGVSVSKVTNNTGIAVLQGILQDGANVLTAGSYNLVAQAGTTAATT